MTYLKSLPSFDVDFNDAADVDVDSVTDWAEVESLSVDDRVDVDFNGGVDCVDACVSLLTLSKKEHISTLATEAHYQFW